MHLYIYFDWLHILLYYACMIYSWFFYRPFFTAWPLRLIQGRHVTQHSRRQQNRRWDVQGIFRDGLYVHTNSIQLTLGSGTLLWSADGINGTFLSLFLSLSLSESVPSLLSIFFSLLSSCIFHRFLCMLISVIPSFLRGNNYFYRRNAFLLTMPRQKFSWRRFLPFFCYHTSGSSALSLWYQLRDCNHLNAWRKTLFAA